MCKSETSGRSPGRSSRRTMPAPPPDISSGEDRAVAVDIGGNGAQETEQGATKKDMAPPARVKVSEGARKKTPLVERVLGSKPLKFYDNLLALAIGGHVGVILRFYLTSASTSTFVAPLFSALTSNMVGCYWMGLVGDGKAAAQQMRRGEPDAEGELLTEVGKVKKEPFPLLPGLVVGGGTASALLGMRTGLCGSLTTFSSWNQSMVKFIVVDKNGWNAVVGYIIGLFVALFCLMLGQLTALYVQQRQFKAPSEWANKMIAFFGQHTWKTRIVASLVLLTALVVEAYFAADLPDDDDNRDLMFGLFFCIVGVGARWQLGRFNARCPSFPIGTFAANMVGAAVIGMVYGLRDDPTQDSYWARLQITSIALGFCGALSTVSTFVAEVNDRLRPIAVKGKASPTCTLSGFTYAMSTLIGGLIIGLATYGWSTWAYE